MLSVSLFIEMQQVRKVDAPVFGGRSSPAEMMYKFEVFLNEHEPM